ncbi:hypothetical protein Tco_1196439 [Tanacetum coccineum]
MPSTIATSLSSIDHKPKSPTSSTSPSTHGYLNSSMSPFPRVPPPPPTQSNGSMDITLTLSPITPLDVQFNTPSPPSPLFGHPIPWNLLEAHGDSCLLIMEYLVNISKRRAFWSLNEDILKITILTTNTPYPSRKIRRIRACTHQRQQRKQAQYAISKKDQYIVLDIWHVNILEDIKRGPYSKKLQYAVSNPLDTPYRTDFQTV